MFRFVSSKNPVKLKKAYLAQYNVNLLQKKLDKLMTDYPNIKAALSDDKAAFLLLDDFRNARLGKISVENPQDGENNGN